MCCFKLVKSPRMLACTICISVSFFLFGTDALLSPYALLPSKEDVLGEPVLPKQSSTGIA